ncbi:MAG: FtsX-like permease family protein, partial [Acidobacteriota bacterium]
SPAIALAQPRAVEKCGLVATLGVAAGFLLASWLLSAVPALGLAGLPPSAEIRIDMRVAGFAMLLAVGTAVLFGSVPAAFASRLGAVAGLRNAARDGGRGSGRPRNALVAAEVALAMILLVGAGLLARSFWRLTQVDPGFRTERLVAVPLSLAGNGRQTGAERYAFLNQVLGRLQELPGVEDVTAVNRLPLGGPNVLVGVEAEAEPSPDGFGVSTDRRVVTPGYFDIMGIELIDGRAFDARDNADTGTPAAILNQQAARLLWPDQQALGRRLHLRLRGGPGPWRTVVGVVGAVHHHGLDRAVRPEVYVPYAQASVETMVALLRGPADLAALKPLIQDAIWDLDPNLPLDGVQDVEAVVSASVSEPRFRALLLSAFASLALLLAAIGVASVISVSVAQRTRDIAIRVALGAQRGEILWMNVREGLALGALGAAIGLAGSVALSRLVEALLFEVTPNDPLTLAAAAAGLLLVVAAASYLPARRATRIDPLEAMRAQ